jgi:AraC family transcriptional regulator
MNRSRREYERRVYAVVDYIEKNPAEQLSLERLASIAAFSPYHFHRVFKSITGETLFGFSQRLRIENGAQALLATRNRSVMDIAQQCGFASAATFARAFRTHFDMTATDWRSGGYRRWREWGKLRNSGNADSKASKARYGRDRDNAGRMKNTANLDVRIQALPSYRVACMRFVGPYGPQGIPQLWGKVRTWMAMHDLIAENELSVGIAYDNPNIAVSQTCRYDAGVVVSSDFALDRRVSVTDTASGRYAITAFSGTAAEIAAAWDLTFSAWIPDSGFAPDDKPCIELYRGTTGLDPSVGAFTCELCLPVQPL